MKTIRPTKGVLWGLLALALVTPLFVASGGPAAPYRRAEWGGWTTEGCQDTRTRVLVRDAEPGTILWRDGEGEGSNSSKECEVAYGRWTDPYTGAVISDPSRIDVDHMVPLKNAHESGGWRWSRERKRAYANDLNYRNHLRATLGSVNRAKGDKGPDRWRPPKREAWCAYSLAYGAIKFRWGLSGTEAERLAVGEMMKTCGNPDALTIFDAAPGS